MVVIPVDLIEGVIQIFLLNAVYDVAWMKACVTPLKLGIFLTGLGLSLISLGVLVFGKR